LTQRRGRKLKLELDFDGSRHDASFRDVRKLQSDSVAAPSAHVVHVAHVARKRLFRAAAHYHRDKAEHNACPIQSDRILI
jgi:hypothetical protein